MSRSSPLSNPEPNHLLQQLPHPEYRRLALHFEPVAFEIRQPLFHPDQPIEQVYFPRSGVFSLLVPMRNGDLVEAATVGNEGMVGVSIALDGVQMHLQTMCQIPGHVVAIPTIVFRNEIQRSRCLRRLMHRYAHAMMLQFSQGVACNRLHTIEQRCARWLLMTRDRVNSDTFPLTHDFLGQMLGVRRAGVTVVAGMLQKAGLIQYTRGVIRILDPPGLEKQACECYFIVRGAFHRLNHPGEP